jgi:hypothetical protein
LAELGRKAEAATPGSWRIAGDKIRAKLKSSKHYDQVSMQTLICTIAKNDRLGRSYRRSSEDEANADYIAFMDPATALALKAEIERMRKALKYAHIMMGCRDSGFVTIFMQCGRCPSKNECGSRYAKAFRKIDEALKEADDD